MLTKPHIALTIGSTDELPDVGFWINPDKSGYTLRIFIPNAARHTKPIASEGLKENPKLHFYLPGQFPRYPRILFQREHAFLLNEPRPAICCEYRFSYSHHVEHVLIGETLVKNVMHINGDELPHILSGIIPCEAFCGKVVDSLWSLSLFLFENRKQRLKNAYSAPDSTHDPVLIKEEVSSALICAEMKILANAALADFANTQHIPLFFQWGHGERATYHTVAHEDPILQIPAYCKATAPLRMTHHLINQMQIFAALQKNNLPYTKNQIENLIAKTIATPA